MNYGEKLLRNVNVMRGDDMPHPEIHCKICKLIFGDEYRRVNLWLDWRFDGTNHRKHWIYRHHLKAIYRKFKDEDERRVAIFHVLLDWLYYYKIIFLPRNRQEVIDKLLEHGFVV